MASEMRPNRIPLAWLLGYVVVIACVLGGLIYARQLALSTYGSQVAQEEWDAWRDDAKKMASSDGPVRRRMPKSVEPPALVLMRDYFLVCMTIALVLCTVLYGTIVLLVRGIAGTPTFVDRSLPEKRR
jgi:hypothetical protein